MLGDFNFFLENTLEKDLRFQQTLFFGIRNVNGAQKVLRKRFFQHCIWCNFACNQGHQWLYLISWHNILHVDIIVCIDDFFSSHEPKAQVCFSDHNLFVVYRCWHCRKLFTFSSSSPEPLGQFQQYLAQSILEWRGFKFPQMKGPTLFQGEIILK